MTNVEIENLVIAYAGDDAWRRFVAAYLPAWMDYADKEILLVAVQDKEIASVVAGLLGQRSVAWFASSIPALGGARPDEVVKQSNGKLAIRALLMRMP